MKKVDLVEAAKLGDHKAFAELVKSHQNLALGFAFSKLGDFHRAQDVVQESFIIAYQKLNQLNDPKAFSGWFRGIVHHRCLRIFRMKLKKWAPLEELIETDSNEESQINHVQNTEEKKILKRAILELPEQLRTVVSLFYLEEGSQKSVADFLGISATKVNNCLHEARLKLKERLINMSEDTFRDQRLSEEFSKNIGEIISINGSVIETKVNKSQKTTVFDVLGSKTKANNPGPDLIVVQRLKDGKFRCISTGEINSEKAKLYNSGNFEKASKELKEEKIVETVNSIQLNGEKPLIETGIKVIDLLSPLRARGSTGIFGREGVGRLVQLQEIIHRRMKIKDQHSLFFYVDKWHALGTQDALETDPDFSTDINDNIQTAWIIHEKAGDPAYAKEANYLDSRLYFSPIKAAQGIWPAIDPLHCYSSAMDRKFLSKEHFDTAEEVLNILRFTHDKLLDPEYLELIALDSKEKATKRRKVFLKDKLEQLDPSDRKKLKRGLLLEQFFTQPFFIAEEFTGRKGEYVPLLDTIKNCKKILSGDFDENDLEEVSFKGSI